VNEAMLTGESRPLTRGPGDSVLAGSHNLASTLRVRVDKAGTDTRFAAIVALMQSAATEQPQVARLADRMAKPFLLGVLLAAGLVALWWWPRDPAHAMMLAVAVLVVTCPCALSLATPAAMLAAAGRLAIGGVLVRRLQALETLAKVDTVVFDKTGTLSSDAQQLDSTQCRPGLRPDEALAMAVALARHSRHPAARALCEAVQATAQLGVCQAKEVQETAGQGLSGQVMRASAGRSGHLAAAHCDAGAVFDVGFGEAPRSMRLGSATFCGLADPQSDSSSVFLRDEIGWVATFQLRELLRPDARRCVQDLEAMGLAVHLLSGDAPGPVALASAQLGIAPERAHARCTPDDKLARLRQLQAQGATVAMVGDGMNDAPVLAGAHVAFAFGNASSLAQSQADLVVLGSQLGAITDTLVLARKTMRVVRQNLLWALLYNAACVPLAVAGLLPAWLAGLGMASSSLLVVANAARLARSAQTDSAMHALQNSKPVIARP
jgi:Cu2+-exporting ATPase